MDYVTQKSKGTFAWNVAHKTIDISSTISFITLGKKRLEDTIEIYFIINRRGSIPFYLFKLLSVERKVFIADS